MKQDPTLEIVLNRLRASVGAGDLQALFIGSLPGFHLRCPLWLSHNVILLPPEPDRDSHRDYILFQSIKEVTGWPIACAHFYRFSPDSTCTLVCWTGNATSSEHDLLRLPIAVLSLLLDSPRPIVLSDGDYVQPAGKCAKHPQQILYRVPQVPLCEITPLSGGQSHAALGDELASSAAKLMQDILEAEKADMALRCAIDLLLAGDSKWGFADQVRTRIMEYGVGLESILLEQESELAYRFALRLSTLLEPAGDKMAIYQQARELYKYRSSAVHAGKRASLLGPEDADRLRRDFRRALRRYVFLLRNGMSRSDILDLLDCALLSRVHSAQLAGIVGDDMPWPVDVIYDGTLSGEV